MSRVLRLWAEIFVLSWRRVPGLTLATLAALAVRVFAVAGSALALRAAVDAATKREPTAAVLAAAAAAVAYGLLIVVQDITDALLLTVGDRVGRLDIHPRIFRDLATIESLDHLERPEYLDHITLVRKAGSRLAAGMWNTLRSVGGVAGLIASLLVLGSVSPWLTLLLAFAAVPIWFDNRAQLSIIRADLATAEPYRLQQHLFGLGLSASEGKEIRVSGAGPELVRRQAEAWQEAMRPRARAQMAAGVWALTGWTVFSAAFVAGLVLAVDRTAHGHGSPGDLVLLVTIAVTLRASVQSIVESTAATMSVRQFIAPYLWLEDYAKAARASATAATEPPATLSDGITIENLGYQYPGASRPALEAVDIKLPAGSVVAIVGEYGSGKTTLVKLLCKFYAPQSGRITVDGTDLAGLRASSWRSRSTAAFQDFGRFHTAFIENVGLGDLPSLADEDRVRAALADADALELAEGLPDGLNTLLGRELGGFDLSEGQWQRTALARASMRSEPLLMVLDEPTASLDAHSEHAIFKRYMERARELSARTGAVTVVVSHRFSTVTDADLILVLEEGRLAAAGSHAELLAQGGTYAELYAIQAEAYRMPADSPATPGR
ncbi:ABC-type multidrug transport system fused ATPase/permease subunit [Catenulispora sp. GP43]|uniref:ATP-binding cassette domain-containing protein n=1 Tax=Catenulispora sp. GP43 TaxID=3156263 RepID=UPI003513763A